MAHLLNILVFTRTPTLFGIVLWTVLGVVGCSPSGHLAPTLHNDEQLYSERAESASDNANITDNADNTSNSNSFSISPESPKRIILLIADGMGIGSISAGAYASTKPLAMLQMPEVGFITTHEYEFITTDSAAAATALATGRKTHFEGISVRAGTSKEGESDPQNQLRTAVHAAQSASWQTGLVATARINHATPAAFAAHRTNRNDYHGIAADLSTAGVDLLFGAGYQYFDQVTDGDSLTRRMETDGYCVFRDVIAPNDLVDAGCERVAALLYPKDMPFGSQQEREISLAEMTDQAIRYLDHNNDEGFFLMVEASYVDWALHDLDSTTAVKELLDFDAAVAVAVDYASKRDDTLIIVTSDHDTAGLSVLDYKNIQKDIDRAGGTEKIAQIMNIEPEQGNRQDHKEFPVQKMLAHNSYYGVELNQELALVMGHLSVASRPLWQGKGRFSGMHTATMVPVFAYGPGASSISNVTDNALLGQKIIEFIDDTAPDQHSQVQPTHQSDQAKPSNTKPDNIVVIISDGLGLSALSAAYYTRGTLSLMNAPSKALTTPNAIYKSLEKMPYASDSTYVFSHQQKSDLSFDEQVMMTLNSLATDGEPFLFIVNNQLLDTHFSRLDRSANLINEIIEFDNAVESVVEFAQSHENTLVIVLTRADTSLSIIDNHYGFHKGQCGVASICGGDYEIEFLPVAYNTIYNDHNIPQRLEMMGKYSPAQIALQYAWLFEYKMNATDIYDHAYTKNLVPVFAYGPWSHALKGFINETDLIQVINQ